MSAPYVPPGEPVEAGLARIERAVLALGDLLARQGVIRREEWVWQRASGPSREAARTQVQGLGSGRAPLGGPAERTSDE